MSKDRIACPVCNKRFTGEKALEMHTNAKHPQNKKAAKSSYSKPISKWIFVVPIVILAVLGLFVMARAGQNQCKNTPAKEINIGGHQNLALHIHPWLKIRINGNNQLIPGNVGIGTNIMRPIHTHDATGELHVEGPCVRDFMLGEFFDIWGKRFDETCIFEFCANDAAKLSVFVNGVENFEFRDLILRDGDRIEIVYG